MRKRISVLVLLVLFALLLTSCSTGLVKYKLNKNGDSYSARGVRVPTVMLAFIDIELTYNGLPVTSIADGGFSGFDAILEVVIPGSVKTIGNYAFGSCPALAGVFMDEGTEMIGDFAFANCESLDIVYMPRSINQIGDGAFGLCAYLTSIVYNGTKSEWEAIEKGSAWCEGAGELTEAGGFVVSCTDGIVYYSIEE